MRDDKYLISQYLQGNETALTELIDRYLKDSYNFAFNLVRDRDLADDIVQESFIKAWKKIRSFSLDKKFSTWLFTIIRNTAIDRLRAKSPIPFSILDESSENETQQLADSAPSPQMLLQHAEDEKYVEKLLSDLDPKYAEIIRLKSENYTFAEISKTLKRPLNTIKSQYRRAILSIQKAYLHQNTD